MALSLLIAVQLVGALADQVSISAAITCCWRCRARLSYLTQELPQSRFVLDFILRVRDQPMWLLLVAVLWAALDMEHPADLWWPAAGVVATSLRLLFLDTMSF